MPTNVVNNQVFDARPDRIDYRDRPYAPPLVSLPAYYPAEGSIERCLTDFAEKGLILDQGQEGACTGFGLAAVVNYLLWLRTPDAAQAPAAGVSPRMFYHLARIYDEWAGEDYAGSSCRGAMKGWHRHGVCLEEIWPYRDGSGQIRFVPPDPRWQQDAAKRPLGAYYRIDKDSVTDMQAAIHEVGAIYVSAAVHDGWFLAPSRTLPVIEMKAGKTGGHAFAMVGYTPDGFIVQNSWGNAWGYKGFAVMRYQDWIQHGSDAWVAVMGAPISAVSANTFTTSSLIDAGAGKAGWSWNAQRTGGGFSYKNPKVAPLSESDAYGHALVMGNNGRPLNRFLDVLDADKAVERAVLRRPQAWLGAGGGTKLALYAHGGLNDEKASIERIRVLAPYFLENGIYPLFFTWKTGVLESLRGILGDAAEGVFGPLHERRSLGWIADFGEQLAEAKDRSLELACEHVVAKPVWQQIKQNAGAAAMGDGGLAQAARLIGQLMAETPGLELHLIGHSAGAILVGHLLDRLLGKVPKISSLTLFAPACTLAFANRYLGKSFQKELLRLDDVHVDLMSNERELADSVGPYGKSLLYLVSRALEDVHKMPLLGMESAWTDNPAADIWYIPQNKRHLPQAKWENPDIVAWRKLVGTKAKTMRRVHDRSRQRVFDGVEEIPLAHGSFDNDVEVMTATIERIRGGALAAPIESLHGF